MSVQTLKGQVKTRVADVSGTKNGKTWTKKTFVLKPFDGGKDVFVSTFGKFDNNLVGKNVEIEADFNETYKSYSLKGDIKEINFAPSQSNVATEVEEVEDTVREKPKRGRPAKSTTAAATPVATGGVDWAAKDRAMAAGGILHDAAALVAPIVTIELTLEQILHAVQETAVGLVAVKRKVEEALK